MIHQQIFGHKKKILEAQHGMEQLVLVLAIKDILEPDLVRQQVTLMIFGNMIHLQIIGHKNQVLKALADGLVLASASAIKDIWELAAFPTTKTSGNTHPLVVQYLLI
jgi:hypothetical protein